MTLLMLPATRAAWIPCQCTTDDHDIVANVRLRAEFNIAQNRDDLLVHPTIDVDIAKNGDRTLTNRTRHPCVTKNGDNGFGNIAGTARGAENRYYCVRGLTRRKLGIFANRDDCVAISAASVEAPDTRIDIDRVIRLFCCFLHGDFRLGSGRRLRFSCSGR